MRQNGPSHKTLREAYRRVKNKSIRLTWKYLAISFVIIIIAYLFSGSFWVGGGASLLMILIDYCPLMFLLERHMSTPFTVYCHEEKLRYLIFEIDTNDNIQYRVLRKSDIDQVTVVLSYPHKRDSYTEFSWQDPWILKFTSKGMDYKVSSLCPFSNLELDRIDNLKREYKFLPLA